MKKSKGFTLIELLVVIAIIGILAAIVLVSLSGARNKAKDVRITADMGQIRTTAEIVYSNAGSVGSYAGILTDADITTLRADITAQGGTSFVIPTAPTTSYCASVKLNNLKYWCVDSALHSSQYDTAPAGCTTACTTACACQ
jgi:type IV pilus assembly protein PilA